MQVISIPSHEEFDPISIEKGDHKIGEVIGKVDGPSLIVFGGVHGNEQSGVLAMRKILPALEKLKDKVKGRVYLLAGNTRALNKNVRFIDKDLNRHWTEEIVKHNSPTSHILINRVEDKEQRELLSLLKPILESARDEVFAMDLHSTSAESAPFAMIGDTLRNRRFALKFPATILLGIEEQLDGTILEYLNNLGAVTLGFEAGQHTTKVAVDNQEALVWLAIINSGILHRNEIDFAKYEQVLENGMGSQELIEVRHRHGIVPTDEFKMELGYDNFQPIKKGEILAKDRRGIIRAIEKGLILMPLYQDQGEDGFFIGRKIAKFWLGLSSMLRKMRVGGFMHFLPGVRQDKDDRESLIVNTNIARLVPLQVFHLLGFRKRRWRSEKLVVSRRRHDTISPFKRNGIAQ